MLERPVDRIDRSGRIQQTAASVGECDADRGIRQIGVNNYLERGARGSRITAMKRVHAGLAERASVDRVRLHGRE